MDDYKYAAQIRAEEIAEESGMDFWDLPREKQAELYQKGLEAHWESRMERADYLRKREREEGK